MADDSSAPSSFRFCPSDWPSHGSTVVAVQNPLIDAMDARRDGENGGGEGGVVGGDSAPYKQEEESRTCDEGLNPYNRNNLDDSVTDEKLQKAVRDPSWIWDGSCSGAPDEASRFFNETIGRRSVFTKPLPVVHVQCSQMMQLCEQGPPTIMPSQIGYQQMRARGMIRDGDPIPSYLADLCWSSSDDDEEDESD